jgi:hypothetical protein
MTILHTIAIKFNIKLNPNDLNYKDKITILLISMTSMIIVVTHFIVFNL